MKVLYIVCEDGAAYQGHEMYLMERLKVEGDQWDVHKPWEAPLPSPEAVVAEYDAVLIPGSHRMVYENLDWFQGVIDIIRCCARPDAAMLAACGKQKPPKIVGVCFGCQIIGHALGGRVGKNVTSSFEYGVESVTLQNLDNLPWARPLVESRIQQLGLIVVHGQSVLALPSGARCIGSSQSNPNEIFMYSDNILAFQPHPELNGDVVTRVFEPNIVQEGEVTAERVEVAREQFRQPRRDGLAIEAIGNFLYRN